MNEQTARDPRKQTVKELKGRVERVTEIIRSSEGRAAEVIAREIVDVLEGDAVMVSHSPAPIRR